MRRMILTLVAAATLSVVMASSASADHNYYRPPCYRPPVYRPPVQCYYRPPVYYNNYGSYYNRASYQGYGYSRYYGAGGHFGIQGRNFSLHFGY